MRKFIVATLFLALTLAACGETPAPTTTTGTTPTVQATQAPTAPTATPTHALKWTTTQTINGNGAKKTGIFTVPDDWKILWSCVGGDYGGYLSVTVYDSNAAYVDGAVNSMCKAGNQATTGETEEHMSGSVYLDVNGTGDWQLQVQEMK